MDGGRQFMDDGGWRMMNGGECQSLAEYLAVNKTMKCDGDCVILNEREGG